MLSKKLPCLLFQIIKIIFICLKKTLCLPFLKQFFYQTFLRRCKSIKSTKYKFHRRFFNESPHFSPRLCMSHSICCPTSFLQSQFQRRNKNIHFLPKIQIPFSRIISFSKALPPIFYSLFIKHILQNFLVTFRKF